MKTSIRKAFSKFTTNTFPQTFEEIAELHPTDVPFSCPFVVLCWFGCHLLCLQRLVAISQRYS